MLSPAVVRVATDFDGAFRFTRPRSADRMTCTVSAPTFATRAFRVPAARTEPLQVFLSQSAAMLTVTVPASADARRAFLFHNDAVIPAPAFAYLAAAPGDASTFTAFVEEGEWSLCLWNDTEAADAERGAPVVQKCRSTRAAAGGRAELKF